MFDAHIYIYIICVCSYYKGIRQMVPVSDQDMNTHLAEVSRVRNTFWLTTVCYFYRLFQDLTSKTWRLQEI